MVDVLTRGLPGSGSKPNLSAALLVPLVALALVVPTLLVYACVVDFQFIKLDDNGYVFENRHVQAGLTPAGVRWALTTFEQGNWHPLTWLSLQLDYVLYGGLKPGGFHFTNVTLHAANTALLFLVLWRMTTAVWRSALAAGLFALHPLHVESVAWVAERKDVLSTLFWLLTMWAYVAYVGRPGRWRYGLVLLTFALGLMAKPMLVTLPLVLLLLDYWPLGRCVPWETDPPSPHVPTRRLLMEKLPLLAMTVASCVVTLRAQATSGAVGSLEVFPVSMRLQNALAAYVGYLGKLVWPAHLAFFYPYPSEAPPTAQALAAGALLLVVTLGTFISARRRPYLVVGWLWYLGTLVPVIGIVQVGGQALADRYTYVPLIGIFVSLAWASGELAEAGGGRWLRVAVPAAALVALAACSIRTLQQLVTWDNTISVGEQAVAATQNNYFAHSYLGHAYLDAGLPQKAWKHYTRAMELHPVEADVLNGFGVTCLLLGRGEQAQNALQAAVTLEPGLAQAHYNLALACALDPAKLKAALTESRQAVQLDGSQPDARYLLAHLTLASGDREEAIRHYQAALGLAPDWPLVLNRRAVRLLAGKPAAWQIAQALLLAQQACEATKAGRADFLETLAVAEAAAGRYAEAAQILRKALALPSESTEPERRRALEHRIRLYEQAKRTGSGYVGS